MLNEIKNVKKQKMVVLILTFNNSSFYEHKWYQKNLLGTPMIEWVKSACKNFPTKVLEGKNNVVELAKPYALKYEYVCILYCNTPLLTSQSLETALDFAILKKIPICKLPNGYVFNSSEILNPNPQQPMQPFSHMEEEFFAVVKQEDFEFAYQVLQKRINRSWQNKGVTMIQSSSVFIEPSVTLVPPITIYPNNFLHGKTIINSHATLWENNIIHNCIIGTGAQIKQCSLKNMEVKNGENISGIYS